MIDEESRLAELQRYDVLDTAPEPAFDRLAQLAADVCQAEMAMINFVDERRQWAKARFGLELVELPRAASLCAEVVDARELLVIEDATVNPRLAQHPLVVGEPMLRFYAGAPLMSPAGYALGTVCVLDRRPRRLAALEQGALELIRDEIMHLLETRRELSELRRSEALRQEAVEALLATKHDLELRVERRTRELRESEQRLVEAQAVAHVGSWEWSVGTNQVTWSDELFRIYGLPRAEVAGSYESFLERVYPADRAHTEEVVAAAYRSGGPFVYEHRIVRADGEVRMLHTRATVMMLEGRPLRMVGSCWDITDRWLATRKLERSEAILRTGLDMAVVPVLIDDGEGPAQANEPLLLLAGVSADDPIAGDAARLLEQLATRLSDGDSLRGAIQRAAGDRETELRFGLTHADGRTIECSSRVFHLDGVVAGRVWFFRVR